VGGIHIGQKSDFNAMRPLDRELKYVEGVAEPDE
jgi:hypothetical protein